MIKPDLTVPKCLVLVSNNLPTVTKKRNHMIEECKLSEIFDIIFPCDTLEPIAFKF